MTCLTDLKCALTQKPHEYLTIDWYISSSRQRKIQFRIDFRLELPIGLQETDVCLWVTTGRRGTLSRVEQVSVLLSFIVESERAQGNLFLLQFRGERPMESKALLPSILPRIFSSVQALPPSASSLPALRPWNIIHVTNFILIRIGTQ